MPAVLIKPDPVKVAGTSAEVLMTLPYERTRAVVQTRDGVCAVSLYPLSAHDVVAGHALLRASGGVLLDQDGKSVSYRTEADMAVVARRCFGGALRACLDLSTRDWDRVMRGAY